MEVEGFNHHDPDVEELMRRRAEAQLPDCYAARDRLSAERRPDPTAEIDWLYEREGDEAGATSAWINGAWVTPGHQWGVGGLLPTFQADRGGIKIVTRDVGRNSTVVDNMTDRYLVFTPSGASGAWVHYSRQLRAMPRLGAVRREGLTGDKFRLVRTPHGGVHWRRKGPRRERWRR